MGNKPWLMAAQHIAAYEYWSKRNLPKNLEPPLEPLTPLQLLSVHFLGGLGYTLEQVAQELGRETSTICQEMAKVDDYLMRFYKQIKPEAQTPRARYLVAYRLGMVPPPKYIRRNQSGQYEFCAM